MQIIDISDPSLPNIIASYDIPGYYTNSLYISGNYAFIAKSTGLFIINISNPLSPLLEGSYSFAASDIYICSNYAYIVNSSGLQIINFFDIAEPEIHIKFNSNNLLNSQSEPLCLGGILANTTINYALTIYNYGSDDLFLTRPINKVEISGDPEFTISTQPPSIIPPSESADFIIQFQPTSIGVFSGTVTIDCNDRDENHFIFAIEAIGLPQWSETKILANDGTTDDLFGTSVSISDNYAFVGAPGDDDNGDNSGSVYVFYFNGINWVEQQKLIPSDNSMSDYFGYSLSISGNYAIIGAYGDDNAANNSGSAYIYYYNGNSWIEQQKLIASDSSTDDNFGKSVSIEGNYAIVGSYYDDIGENNNQGSVYIYYFDGMNWIEQQQLFTIDGKTDDCFGYSVYISDTELIVGAKYDDENDNDAGSAYVYNFNGITWTKQQKLIANDGAKDDWLGCSVCIFGNYAIVGACGDDINTFNPNTFTGAAYIYYFNGTHWIEQQKIASENKNTYDYFGYSIHSSNDYLIVGEPGFQESGGSVNIFYNYKKYGIVQQTLKASDGANYLQFGKSVSISDNYALVGAPGDDDYGSNSGSAYIFTINTPEPTLEPTSTPIIDPIILTSYDTQGAAFDVVVNGKYAYIADGGAGLQILDITTPTTPIFVGSYGTPSIAYEVFIQDDYAYLANYLSGLQILDISNPTSPILIGYYDTPSYAYGVFVNGNYAFVADGQSGLQIIDVSNPTSPILVGTYDTPSNANGIFVDGNYAYIADGQSGLQIIDISTLTSPIFVSTVSTSDYTNKILIQGEYAYIADASSLKIINISNPLSPILIENFTLPSWAAQDIFIDNNYAYIAKSAHGTNEGSFLIFDISNPSSVSLIASNNTSDSRGVYVMQEYAYIADFNSGLKIIRLYSNPDP